MKELTQKWMAVAFAVSMLVATAGVGGAQTGPESADSASGSVVEPPSLGLAGESPKAAAGGGSASNGPENGNDKSDRRADEAGESAASDGSGEKTKSGSGASRGPTNAESPAEAPEKTERAAEDGAGNAEGGANDGAGKAEDRANGESDGGAKVERGVRAEKGKGKERGNPTVGFRVRDAAANETVSLRVGPPENASGEGVGRGGAARNERASDGGMAVDELSLRTNSGGDFTVNVTTGREAFETTPRFERGDGTEAVGHVRVDHSVPDANITNASFTFRLSDERLAEAAVVPEDVALYRYHGGTWNELETAVVNETSDGVVFRAESPGLSEFAAGAKRPKFELDGATVNVSKVVRGDSVYVNVDVTNVGAADGAFTADLVLNDMVVDSKEVTIAAGGSRRLVFERTFDYPGTYDVRVNGVFAGTVVVAERSANETASRTPPRSVSRPSDGGDVDRFGVRALVDAVGGLARSASETVRRFGR